MVSTRHHLLVGFVGFCCTQVPNHVSWNFTCWASFPILSWPFVSRFTSFQTNALSFMVVTTLR